ncbi:MAG: hypothetical protein U5K30_07915 [Acidimicrobiales bacterium]|nr:hypothetical protein [Acidimicrobiales bacterium]
MPALDPDATEAARSADRPAEATPTDQVPPEQRPGHRPDDEQDKPDLDAFAERLGTVPPERTDDDVPHRQRWRTPVEIAVVGLGVAGILYKMLRTRRRFF